jgi:hypothetical protein
MTNGGERIEDLLGCLIQVIGRAAVPEARVREIVGDASKQIRAFNLCDGTRTQTEIRKAVGLDSGNFHRTAKRWIESGVAFEFRKSNESRLLHVYPLTKPAGRAKGAR